MKVGDYVKVKDKGDSIFKIIRDDGDYNYNLLVKHQMGAQFWRSKEDLTIVERPCDLRY